MNKWVGGSVVAVLALVALGVGSLTALGSGALVSPPMQSIGALEFGSDGVLFAGDSRGGTVYALQVGSAEAADGEFSTVRDLDSKIAALLGTSPRDIFIKDMAVDGASGSAYLSVMRGSGDAAVPVLMRVTSAGQVQNVDLQELRYTKLELTDAPQSNPEARRDPRSSTITDMELIDGQLYIAGLSNEEFSSVLRRADVPFDRGAVATGLEIYHGAHGQYETNAPVYTFMPIELDGKPHVLAGYLCTPLVTFSVQELQSSDRMRGKTIAEMGFGNVPIDMISIEQDGEQYVVMTNTRRGTMKFKVDDIAAAYARDGIAEPVGARTGVDYLSSPLGNVVQIDSYNPTTVLILERSAENGSLILSARSTRWM